MTLKMYGYAVYIKPFGSQKGGSSEPPRPPAYGPVKDDTRKDMERGEGERGEGEEYRRVTNRERKRGKERREKENHLPIFKYILHQIQSVSLVWPGIFLDEDFAAPYFFAVV